MGNGNRLSKHWPDQCGAAFLGYHLQANKNAGTCHPPSGELAVPANNKALTRNDIHDMDGLALLAPKMQIRCICLSVCGLIGLLPACRADVQSILDFEFNSICGVLQYFSLQFFLICELFNYISRILILILK